jgi:ceramide glucosyltransferase
MGTFLLVWSALSALLTNALHLTAALVVLRRRPAPAIRPAAELPAVTIIRPLKGLDPDAARCHQSLFAGSYQPAEVLFVVEDPGDPAVPAARAACAAHPERARLLVAPPRADVLSGKVRNMLAGFAEARTPLIGFCDADIELGPDHLALCLQPFADPAVGVASLPILYDDVGPLGRLGALAITVDHATLVRAAARTGVGAITLGGLMIARRDAIDAIGGLAVLGDAFADDIRLGERVFATGREIALADTVLAHRPGREPARSWLARQHRWLTAMRTGLPAWSWLNLLLGQPTAIGLAAALVAGGIAWWVLAASVLVRTATAGVVARWLLRPHGVRLGAWWLARPLADLLHAALLVATLVFPYVFWRGRWFRVRWGSGRILRQVSS